MKFVRGSLQTVLWGQAKTSAIPGDWGKAW